MQSDSSEEKPSKSTEWIESHFGLLLLLGITMIFAALVIVTRPAFFSWFDFSDKGGVGETIGGITAPLIGLLGILAVYLTFKEQRKANKIQSDLLDVQLHARDRLVDELTERLDVLIVPKEGDGIVIRIANPTNYAIHSAIATISMPYKKEDVLLPQDFNTFISLKSLSPLIEDRVVWATRFNGENPVQLNIFAGEEASLALFRFDSKKTLRVIEEQNFKGSAMDHENLRKQYNIIKVASEEGLDGLGQKRIRVALERKNYRFWIKIVSEDTRAKAWEFEFCDGDDPIVKKIGVVSINMLREIQSKLRKWEMPD